MRELRRIEELLENVRDLLSERSEVSVAQVSVLISQVSMLISQVGTLISQRASQHREARVYQIMTVFFGLTTFCFSLFQFTNIGDRFTDIRDQPQEIIDQKPPDVQPESQSPHNIDHSNIMDHLENEPMTDQRFKLLEANLDSVPSSLSLNQLGNYIQLFQHESYRIKVLRLLQPKITDNYSDNELEAFKKLFNPYKQPEAEELLPNRKR